MDTENKLQLQIIKLSCIRQHKPLFALISFELKSGDVVLIEGPNGSGKSSLLRLLAGLSTPAHGDILWRGSPIQHCRANYAESLHYVGHTNGIKLGLTVIENLQMMHHLSLASPRSDISDISELEYVLDCLQLSAYKNTQANYLSAGQKRRLALAKLFLIPKVLWILDEPLTALDITTQTLFLSRLTTHLKNGGIGIVSSHHALALKNVTVQMLRLGPC
jgi:heme exporter protein A